MRTFFRLCAFGLGGIVLLAGCAGGAAVAPVATVQGPSSASPTATFTAAASGSAAPTSGPAAADSPTPAIACTPGALTPAETEGPYYKANPPQSTSLLQQGMGGTKLTITGYVLDAECRPIPGARVDFWQADSEGQYDNQGYTLRGYQLTDAQGRYSVDTVVPGLYPGRTRHIHVKVTAPDGPTMTTQLYFPGEPANASDRIYDPQTVLNITKTPAGEVGTFDFVIAKRTS
jgi:protocatechuate 3,4-dioxygenase beta subunit